MLITLENSIETIMRMIAIYKAIGDTVELQMATEHLALMNQLKASRELLSELVVSPGINNEISSKAKAVLEMVNEQPLLN